MIVIDTNVVSELMRLNPSAAVMTWFSRQDSASLTSPPSPSRSCARVRPSCRRAGGEIA